MGFIKDTVSKHKENCRNRCLLLLVCMIILGTIIVWSIVWKGVSSGEEKRQQEQIGVTKVQVQVPTESAVADMELLQTAIENLYKSRGNKEIIEDINGDTQEPEISFVVEERKINLEAGTDQFVFRYEYIVDGFCYSGKLHVHYEYASQWQMASIVFTELEEWEVE